MKKKMLGIVLGIMVAASLCGCDESSSGSSVSVSSIPSEDASTSVRLATVTLPDGKEITGYVVDCRDLGNGLSRINIDGTILEVETSSIRWN